MGKQKEEKGMVRNSTVEEKGIGGDSKSYMKRMVEDNKKEERGIAREI